MILSGDHVRSVPLDERLYISHSTNTPQSTLFIWWQLHYPPMSDSSQNAPEMTYLIRNDRPALACYAKVLIHVTHKHNTVFNQSWGWANAQCHKWVMDWSIQSTTRRYQWCSNSMGTNHAWHSNGLATSLKPAEWLVWQSWAPVSHQWNRWVAQRLGVTIPGVNKLGIIREKTICNVGYT